MKKLLAILMALVMVSFAALSVCAAAPEAGTVYDLKDGFGTADYLATSPFSFGVMLFSDGSIVNTDTYVDGTNPDVKCNMYAQPYIGYGINNEEVGRVDVFDSKVDAAVQICWYPSHKGDAVVVFTAPVGGVYEFDFVASLVWSSVADYTPSRMHVMVGGNDVEGCSKTISAATADYATANADTDAVFNGTVTLNAGETIVFAYDPVREEGKDSTTWADNGFIEQLTVELVEVKAAPATGDALVAVIALVAVAGSALVICKRR